MKKTVAFLLCFIMIVVLVSCNYSNGNSLDTSGNDTPDTTMTAIQDDNTSDTSENNTGEQISKNKTLQNEIALHAYGKAIRNEINLYYPLLCSDTPSETYFERICGAEKGTPTAQALVDMDNDGIEELILAYDSFFILLHFENDKVYGTDFDFYSRETIYTDGSFSWSHTDNIFGYECGISRVSFVNGILKVEELCRTEGNSKFFIGGVQVTKDQHDDYLEESNRIPVKFTAFEMAIFENNENINELKAIQLASEYWGIMDGEFDPQRGLRFRVICNRKIDEKWYEISLYRFVYNSYYEHLEIATVNIETKEIQVTPYPDGKG